MKNYGGYGAENKQKSAFKVYYENNKMLKTQGVSFHWWRSASTSLHSHNFCEIFIITDGEAVHELNGEKELLSKGTIHFIKPEDTHRIKASKEKGCVHMNLCICLDRLKKILEALSIDEREFFKKGVFKTVLTADELDFFKKRAERINLMKFDGEPDSTIAVSELIIQAIIILYSSKNNLSSEYPDWFANILEKIHSPEFLSCTAADIYALGNFSAPAMIEYFKKYTGHTVSQYLKTVKIQNAKSLLKSTDLSIVEISNMLGYTSLSHFNRLFKEKTGMTPAAYRKSRREKSK
ncbi:MAG: AraC family transcriptional regulator [Acutalibacteraceae bacterium]